MQKVPAKPVKTPQSSAIHEAQKKPRESKETKKGPHGDEKLSKGNVSAHAQDQEQVEDEAVGKSAPGLGAEQPEEPEEPDKPEEPDC